jgi:hypothetical protein
MKRTTWIWMLATVAAAAGGCSGPGVTGGESALPVGNSAELLDKLSGQPTVTQAQAVAAMLMLVGADGPKTFSDGVAELTRQKIADSQWDFQAGAAITRGKLAYMVCQACHIQGGLTMTVTGPSERYCLRELEYRGYMSSGLFYTPVTGMEFVAVMTRADELRRTGKVKMVLAPQEGTR